MKLRSSFSQKELQRWRKERDEACLSYDANKFRSFYLKWQMAGMYSKPLPRDFMTIEAMMRKMVYHMESATQEQKTEAKQWLAERGCSTSL